MTEENDTRYGVFNMYILDLKNLPFYFILCKSYQILALQLHRYLLNNKL